MGEMVWDSGKTTSSESVTIEYKGKALQTATVYFWKVRWWERSQSQPSPYSEFAVFSVGVPNDEWMGQWIGRPRGTAHRLNDGFTRPLQLRTEFELDITETRQVILYGSGLGYYKLYVNGLQTDDRSLGPFTSYYKRVVYDTYNLFPLLLQGKNAIGTRLAPGFWGNDYNGPLMFRFQMHVEFKNGTIIKFVSQAGHLQLEAASVVQTHWKTRDDPCTQAHVYQGERYDARLEEDGWDEPGFNDSHWSDANEVADSGVGEMHGRMMPPILKSRTGLVPVRITEPMPGIFVFDFGQNLAGVVTLYVSGPKGTVVTMYTGELLFSNGTVNNQLREHVNMTTVYTLRGGKTEVFTPSFVYFGFQYVQVAGYPAGLISLNSVRAVPVNSNVKPAGSLEFRQGDRVDTLEGVQHAIRWSQQSNLMSTPTDCPNREKRGWMGDAQVSALVAIWNFDMAAFYQSWIMSMRDEQKLFGTGVVPDIVPSGGKGNPSYRTDASWSSAYLLISLYVYQHYGNIRLIEDLYDGYKAYVDYLDSVTDNETGLLTFHKYGDWCNTYPRTEEIATTGPISASFHYILDLEILAYFAKLTGHSSDANEYQKRADVLKIAFHKYYYNETVNGYVNGTQTQNVLPLYGNFVPEQLVDQVAKSLMEDITITNHMHLTTGGVGTRFLLPTLTKLGRTDIALALATQTTEPSWGYWITQNATTLWEDWSGVADLTHPPPPTHNHIFLGSHGSWLYEILGGIGQNETSVAFEYIVIRPPQATIGSGSYNFTAHIQ